MRDSLFVGEGISLLTSGGPYAGHGIVGEGFEDWVVLDVGCQYNGMPL